MSLLVDPSRSRDRNASRNRSDKRVRSLQEAKPKDTYYREEYGWIMSDADVAKEGEVKGQYDNAVNETQASIDKARADMQSQVASGRSQINSAYDDNIGGMSTGSLDLVSVKVYNGSTFEKAYTVPRGYAEDLAATEGLNTLWAKDNKSMNIDGPGGQLHATLDDAAKQTAAIQKDNSKLLDKATSNANEQRAAQLKAYDEANAKSLATAEEQWGTALETAQGAYGKRVADGKEQYETSKKNYNDSVMGMDEGLLESRTNKVNPNVGGNKDEQNL
jgi:hypothetical protein